VYFARRRTNFPSGGNLFQHCRCWLIKASCTAGATCITDIDAKFKTNLVRVGLNYRF